MKLTAPDRVILFCAATGIDHAAVGIPVRDMQSMAGDSSRTVARVGRMRLMRRQKLSCLPMVRRLQSAGFTKDGSATIIIGSGRCSRDG